VRYRPHKGSLDESLKYMVDVDGRAGLIAHLRKELDGWQVDVHDDAVRVFPYVRFDHISGWRDVHVVTIDDHGIIGFCEGPAT
jgi:hypothetical protein